MLIRHGATALAERRATAPIAAITHAGPIRYARLCVEGRSLDEWQTIDIATGSITRLDGDGP